MQFFRLTCALSFFLSIILLNGCAAITHQIQHSVNTTGREYSALQPANPVLDRPQFIDLTKYKSPPHSHGLSIAVAASGGGYRAANLVLGVMLGLEKIQNKQSTHNLLQDVNYYSTVSGGGFGVGYYINQLHRYWLTTDSHNSVFSLQKNVHAMLSNDEKQLTAPNPLRADLSDLLFFGENRGQLIEQRLNQSLLATDQGGLRLGDVFVPKGLSQKAHLPIWVTNATIYQNMAIFPFAPGILSRYQITNYFHNQTLTAMSGDIDDVCYGCDVPVAVGLTASASVPFAIPPTTLVSQGCKNGEECYLHLYDGGLADNLGIYTALNLLLQDNSDTKVLIIVDAYTGEVAPFSAILSPPDSVPLLWRILTTVTDASHENLQSNIYFVAHDLLCRKGAKQVLVIHLSLQDFPEAQKITTGLDLDLASQKLLISVGEKLVASHPELKKLLNTKSKLTKTNC